MKTLALFTLGLFLATSSFADLDLKDHGKLIRSFKMDELKKVVAPQSIRVWEPHENREVVYHAFSMTRLLNAIYGDRWKKSEEILFTCTDGYQPSLPISRFTRFPSYLTFEKEPAGSFKVNNRFQGEKDVPLGPFYLVWDNLKHPELKKELADGWPYQVTTIDLIEFSDRFPKMAPAKNASAAAKRGFVAFRKQCMACHTINGDGGKKGFELNYPVGVTEYFKDSWLRKWIIEPTSIRYNTTMPGLNRDEPGWEKHLDDILSYLQSMVSRKVAPQ